MVDWIMPLILFKNLRALTLVFLFAASLVLTGCAPLLIAGGAVGGYAVAKNVSEGSPTTSKK